MKTARRTPTGVSSSGALSPSRRRHSPEAQWRLQRGRRRAAGLVTKISEGMHGAKSIAPSGQAVSDAGLSTPAPITLDRPTNGFAAAAAVAADADAAERVLPDHVAYERGGSRRRRRHEADVARMGLTRVETALGQTVATLSEPINRFWLSHSNSLMTWVSQELDDRRRRRDRGAGLQHARWHQRRTDADWPAPTAPRRSSNTSSAIHTPVTYCYALVVVVHCYGELLFVAS